MWEQRLWTPLKEWLDSLVAAVEREQPDEVSAALGRFVEPTQVVRASVELLVVSTYVPALHDAVEVTFGRWLQGLLSGASRASDARRCLAVGLALGYVLEAGVRGCAPDALCEELAVWSAALGEAGQPVAIPSKRAELDLMPAFDTGDSTWDALLRATVESVSELGYEASTIEVIAARCGFTRTVIFRRYPTKYDLFLDASQRTLGPMVLAMDNQRRIVEADFGTGVSDAWMGREVMRPELRGLRTILLEQVRLATHLEDLREVLGNALMQPERPMSHTLEGSTERSSRGKRATEMALGSGMQLLAQLRPASWSLPYDVVLIPWRETQNRR